MLRIQVSTGKSRLPSFLLIVSVIFSLYFLFKYAPHYITYYQVKQAFFNVAKQSVHLNDEELQEELERRIGSINPPFSLYEIQVHRGEGGILIETVYYVDVWHPYVDKIHQLVFNPRIDL